MGFTCRAAVILGLTVFIVASVQAVGSPSTPKPVVVEVTGYDQIRPIGETGPVLVVVKGKRAAAIRSALAGLFPSSSLPDCVEDEIAFKLTFVDHVGGRPAYLASGQECPAPGIVTVRVGKATRQLTEDCRLLAAVVTALPRGQAEGTRQDEAARCSL
jgi:hypothetical protein